MRSWGLRRALLVVSVCALAVAGGAGAGEDERGIDPNQGESLVEITLANKAAAVDLQLGADSYGIDFNEHYLRKNANGTVTVTVFGTEDELQALQAAGYQVGRTIEGPATWEERAAAREAAVQTEARADAAALGTSIVTPAPGGEIIVLRVDYFENYDGRFLSVEAKDRLGGSTPTGSNYTGPTLSLSWNTGPGTAIDSGPRTMSVNIDPDTSPDTYIEHRELVRIGEAGSTSPGRPTMIRIGSSTGESVDAPVDIWLGGGLPPMSSTFLKDFTTRYMDPTEVYGRCADLARVGPRGRKRHHRRVPEPRRPQLSAGGRRDRERHRRQPRHERTRGSLEHRGTGGVGRERRSAGAAARGGAHVPRQCGRRDRAAAGQGEPLRLPVDGRQRARDARAVRVLGAPDRQEARRHEGRRVPVLPAARPRMGDTADVSRDRRAAASELRDRQEHAAAGRSPRHLH